MNRRGKIIRGTVLFVILCGLLNACASTSNMSDTNTIPPGKGIMVFRTSAQYNFQLHWEEYSTGLFSIGIQPAVAAEPGQKVWVLTVDPGHYMWANVSIAAFFPPLEANFRQSNRFEVEEGKINYIGDVVISAFNVNDLMGAGQVGLDIASNTTEMISWLNVWYPQLIAHYPFVEHITEFR